MAMRKHYLRPSPPLLLQLVHTSGHSRRRGARVWVPNLSSVVGCQTAKTAGPKGQTNSTSGAIKDMCRSLWQSSGRQGTRCITTDTSQHVAREASHSKNMGGALLCRKKKGKENHHRGSKSRAHVSLPSVLSTLYAQTGGQTKGIG